MSHAPSILGVSLAACAVLASCAYAEIPPDSITPLAPPRANALVNALTPEATEPNLLAVATENRFVLYDKKTNHAVESYTLRPGWTGSGQVQHNMNPSGYNLFTWYSGLGNNSGAKVFVDSTFVLNFTCPLAKVPFIADSRKMQEHMLKLLSSRNGVSARAMTTDYVSIVDSQDASVIKFRNTYANMARQYGQNVRCSAKEAVGEFTYQKSGTRWKSKVRIPFIAVEMNMGMNMRATSIVLISTISYIYPAAQAKQFLGAAASIIKSRKIDPEWDNMVANAQTSIGQGSVNAARQRSNTVRQAGKDIDDMRRDSYRRKNEAQDRTSRKRSDQIRGVTTVTDPFDSGRTIETTNSTNHVWVNRDGKQINVDDSNYNPNSDPRVNSAEWRQVR